MKAQLNSLTPWQRLVWRIILIISLLAFFFSFSSRGKMSSHSTQQLHPFEQNKMVPDIDLSGSWKFNLHDNMEWTRLKYEDQHWDEIFLPKAWEHQGYKNYDGFAWYRKKIVIPDSLENEKLVLLLGKIDDVDQLYFNGSLIGSIGFVDDHPEVRGNEWRELRGYYIPSNLIKKGKQNQLALRVYDSGGFGGVYKGTIGIITQKKYIRYWREKRHQ